MQKKGVGEIVATVLIIMIVVAAVGILWAAVIPMIKNSLGSSDCSKADVSVASDSVYTCYKSNNVTMVQIKKGTSAVNVSKLIFYLSSGGNMVKYSKSVSLFGAGLSVYAFNSSKISKVDRIGVVPVVGKKECSAIYVEEVFPCGSEEVVGPIINDTCATETCVGKCGTVGECVCEGCSPGFNCGTNNLCVANPEPLGSAGNPYQITDWSDLNDMRNDLDAYYILMNNLDSSSVGYSNSWTPIGTEATPFIGNFNGSGKTISNLTVLIYDDHANGAGLFGYTAGNIYNIGLLGVNLTSFANYAGALAGQQNAGGVISNCYSTGHVVANNSGYGWVVGGLIGRSYGTINNSYSIVNVSGTGQTGGLIGSQWGGTILNSYSIGFVRATSMVGGLVGIQSAGAVINNSYAIGNTTCSGNYVGGLVGQQSGGTISNSYSTENVNGASFVGGLIGKIDGGSLVHNSYSACNVTGSGSSIGGLVGESYSSMVNNNYAIGIVASPANNVGGLIGYAYRSTINNSYSVVNISGSQYVGGLLGQQNGGNISNSYSVANFLYKYNYFGAMVGYAANGVISNLYWYNNSQGLNCYWNSNVGCVARTDLPYFYNYENAPMNLTVGNGWNFVNTWNSSNNGTRFPTLK